MIRSTMKIRFILIIGSLLVLNIPCQGMERPYPLDPADLKHSGVREGTQLVVEKLGELGVNQKLIAGKHGQDTHKVHTAVAEVHTAVTKVHATVHGVDSKVERLSGTLEDGSEIATATMKSIEDQLRALTEQATALNKQTSTIHAEIMRVSAELTALKYLVTPLNMATSNPKVQTAISTPRKTVPLGRSPRTPKNTPDLGPPSSPKASPLNKGRELNPTRRVSSLKTLQPEAQPSKKKKKKKKDTKKDGELRSKSRRRHDKKEKKKGS